MTVCITSPFESTPAVNTQHLRPNHMKSQLALFSRFLVCAIAVMAFSSAAAETLTPTNHGLNGMYYPSRDFSGVPVTRLDQVINLSGSTGIAGIGPQDFSVVWRGRVQAPASETYTFITESDDGVAVWVNDQPLITNWSLHAQTRNEATITLSAGKWYDLRVYYFQGSGASVCQLRWKSATIPEQLIPSERLIPATTDVSQLAIDGTGESWTNPAWIAGPLISGGSAPVASIDGAAVATQVDGIGRWFISNAKTTGPLGVALEMNRPTQISVTQGANTVEQAVHWKIIDLSAPAYGMDPLVLRAGDQILIKTAGLKGLKVTSPDGKLTDLATSNKPKTPLTFATPGDYLVAAMGDQPAGALKVRAVGIDWMGPTACQVGYQRKKAITVLPSTSVNAVALTAGDENRMEVGVTSTVAGTVNLAAFPVIGQAQELRARLGDGYGPIISRQGVDTFKIRTTAETGLAFVRQFPDGAILSTSELIMSPLIKDLTVRLRVFVSGVTFEDSTTTRTVSTNSFLVDELLNGHYTYGLIWNKGTQTGACHAFVVMQGTYQVSR
jgi:hypothetical protein